jgi:hypothetical protein
MNNEPIYNSNHEYMSGNAHIATHFLTLARDGNECSGSHAGCFTPKDALFPIG